MIETATGIAFLMSSLYGVGQANANTAAVGPKDTTITAPVTRTLTDTKEVEAFVRKEFSDTPILIEIARCESTFRQYDSKGQVLRGKVEPKDVGVMQINEWYHGDSATKLGIDIYTIEGNLAFGKHLYEKYG